MVHHFYIDGNGYELWIYISLEASVTGDDKEKELAEINQNVLKALLYKISSTPEKVYKAIFDSWETEDYHGINKKTYIIIGDCKIKYQSGKEFGSYLIQPAK